MKIKKGLLIAVVGAFALTACGGGDTAVSTSTASVTTVTQSPPETTATSDASSEVTAKASRSVKDYLEAMQTVSDPTVVRSVLNDTAPGSPLEVYVNHLANSAEAALDGGVTLPDSTIEEADDNSYRSCDTVDPEVCVTFGDVEVDSEGLYANLKVDGQAIEDRLTAGDGSAVGAADAEFTFLTAYKSVQSNALFVSVKVQTGGQPISPFSASATYRSPDGKQREATQALGPVDIGADSNAIISIAFQGVEVGGQVTLDGCVDECASDFEVVLDVG